MKKTLQFDLAKYLYEFNNQTELMADWKMKIATKIVMNVEEVPGHMWTRDIIELLRDLQWLKCGPNDQFWTLTLPEKI